MKYLVTGSAGLIGKALTQTLADQGHEVIALVRNQIPTEFLEHPKIELAKGDITDVEFLKLAFVGVDGVFHVAAFAKPWSKDKSIYYKINEQGTINVCEAALACGVKRVVYTSSAGIHGPQQGEELIDENTWPNEYYVDYERSKNNARLAANAFVQRGLEVVTVSPARVYGPGEVSESNVPARLFRIYLKNKFGVVPLDGKGVGSYVFMDDLVNGHILAMTKGQNGEEYLLGGINATYLELFQAFAEVSGKKYPVFKLPYQLSLGFGKFNLFLAENFGVKPTITTPWVRRYIKNWGLDISKIEALGYKVTPLNVGLKKVLESWEKH